MTLHAISIAPDGYQNSVEADRQFADLVGNRVAGVIFEAWNINYPLDLDVVPGEGHTAVVTEGQALIREKTNPRDRGGYFFSNTGDHVVQLPVPQSEPFLASIIARVADPQYGAVTGDVGPRIDVVSGVPASAPVAPDDATINALAGTPGGWIRLKDVRINPADTGVVPAGQFTDRRKPGGFGTITCVSSNKPVVTRVGTSIWMKDLGRMATWNGADWLNHGTEIYSSDAGYPKALSGITPSTPEQDAVVDKITIPAAPYPRKVSVSASAVMIPPAINSSCQFVIRNFGNGIGRGTKTFPTTLAESVHATGHMALGAGASGLIEVRLTNVSPGTWGSRADFNNTTTTAIVTPGGS